MADQQQIDQERVNTDRLLPKLQQNACLSVGSNQNSQEASQSTTQIDEIYQQIKQNSLASHSKQMRTPLQNQNVINWVKKRYQQQGNTKYFGNFQEMTQEPLINNLYIMFIKILQKDKLEFNSFLKLFNQYQLPMTYSILKKLYSYTDEDKDLQLNQQEFKKFVLDDNVNSYYTKKLHQLEEQREYDFQYWPRSIGDLVLHLGFLIKHDQAIKVVNNIDVRTDRRIAGILQLFDLISIKGQQRLKSKKQQQIMNNLNQNHLQSLGVRSPRSIPNSLEIESKKYFESKNNPKLVNHVNKDQNDNNANANTDKNEYGLTQVDTNNQQLKETVNVAPTNELTSLEQLDLPEQRFNSRYNLETADSFNYRTLKREMSTLIESATSRGKDKAMKVSKLFKKGFVKETNRSMESIKVQNCNSQSLNLPLLNQKSNAVKGGSLEISKNMDSEITKGDRARFSSYYYNKNERLKHIQSLHEMPKAIENTNKFMQFYLQEIKTDSVIQNRFNKIMNLNDINLDLNSNKNSMILSNKGMTSRMQSASQDLTLQQLLNMK